MKSILSASLPAFHLPASSLLSVFRFGEEPLHSCEVMLHDIDSSKRLNTAITAAIKSSRNENEMEDSNDNVRRPLQFLHIIFFNLRSQPHYIF